MSTPGPSTPDAPRAVVRLTEDAIADLHRLHRKDPQIVRWAFKKMLLLERSVEAGEPLLGDLIGFRKLVVGDRDWRIVWRTTTDTVGATVIDVAEVWAAGARSDDEVYQEMTARVAALGTSPQATALTTVLESMGRLFADLEATPEPVPVEPVPDWLARRLITQVGLSAQEVAAMTPEDAMARLETYWSTPR
ncbi:type II toxin-antitoxin system RelE family toxin [Kocuria rosea]|uniref:type II toxin-antitoxin system RelE family toxin n=1 Tax=Kocuria rosea TaxID=1275 RepID=UPI003D3311C4